MNRKALDAIELRQPVQGVEQRLTSLCVGLTVFTPIPFRESAHALNNLMAAYLSMVPKETFLWQNLGGSARAFKPITATAFATIEDWFGLRRSYGRTCSVWLKDGQAITDAGDNLFNVYGRDDASRPGDSNYLRIYFPFDILEKMSTEEFLSSIHGLLVDVPFHSGYLSYTLNVSTLAAVAPYSRLIDAKSFAVAQRFLGVEVFKPHLENYEMKLVLRPPGWVTFLSAAFIDALGGIDALRQSLMGRFTFRELTFGISIQAGERPRLGDRNRREALAAEQHLLAKTLEPFYSDRPAFLFSNRPHEDTLNWLRRLVLE